MRSRTRLGLVAGALLALALLVGSTPVTAATVISRQIEHGMTQRTIWDTTQVRIIRLPGINHHGALHIELNFRPAAADLDLYLLDAHGNALKQEMGVMATVPGREVIDFPITKVVDTSIAVDDEGAQYMVGDTYYLAIVAFKDTAEYQVWGYYPEIDLATGSSPGYDWNYSLKEFRFPEDATEWDVIKGPAYGYPYDFKPTSLGEGEARLEWPAEELDGGWTVTYDPQGAPKPVNMEQYLYAGVGWETVLRNYGDTVNYLPAPLPGGGHGLSDTFSVSRVGAVTPHRTLHYVPSLYLAYENALLGPDGAPSEGLITVGIRATLTYPENLRLDRAVRWPRSYAVAGTLSLNGVRVPGAEVEIERQTRAGDWKTIRTVTTDERGWWFLRLRPVHGAMKIRASAAGDPATGLDREYSISTVLKKL
jgi:hypothetical protein